MTLNSKKPVRRPSKRIQLLVMQSKQRARPPIKPPNPDADPLGLFPALFEKLKQTYDAQVRAFLRKFLLVGGLAPAVRRSISAAVTAQGGSVSLDVTLTLYPPDASAFARVDGALITPVVELAAETERDEQSDDPEYGPYFTSLFGERVRARRPKGGWRKFARRP
jgi:hypothetical protein